MNERLTIQDLIDLLAAKHSMTKKDAEAFVKEFFLLIEQALEHEQYVKIKGLGTFKLIDVESRESIKVNTGERFQIKGHTKVSFVPDTGVRDSINKPFAHFETVILNEKTVLEDTLIEDSSDDEITGELKISVENENSETDALIVSKEMMAEDKEQQKIENREPDKESVLESAVPIQEESIIEEPVIAGKISDVLEEVIEKEEMAEVIIHEEPVKSQPVSCKKQPEVTTSELCESGKLEKSPVPYLIIAIIIALLLCGGAVLYIYYPDLFSSSSSWSNKNGTDLLENTEYSAQHGTQLTDSIEQKDTVEYQTVTTTELQQTHDDVLDKHITTKKEQQTVPEQTKTLIYSDSVCYIITGTKVTHTIKVGETLTKVSLHYYGTKAMWPYIVKHNPTIITNPDNIPYGTTIKIPELKQK